MADVHPDDLTLIDYVDGLIDDLSATRVRRHLEGCRGCRDDAHRAADVEVPSAPFPSAEQAPLVPIPLLSTLAQSKVKPFRPGQLWRVSWQDRTALVLVTGPAQAGTVPVVAAAAADSAPEASRLSDVPADDSPLGFALRLYPAATVDLPGFVFDILLTELDPLPELAAPHIRAHPLDPGGWLDATVAEQMEWFADATWLPRQEAPVSIPDAARRAGLTAAGVSDALGVGLPRAVQLLRGVAEPSVAEQAVLAELLDVDPGAIGTGIDVPDALVVEFNDPGLRTRLRARARRQNIGEPGAMRQVARQALRPAARRAGRADAQLNWRQVIDDILSGEQP